MLVGMARFECREEVKKKCRILNEYGKQMYRQRLHETEKLRPFMADARQKALIFDDERDAC